MAIEEFAPRGVAVQTVSPARPELRGPELRAHALGSRAQKWSHEIVSYEGQSILVRSPTVAAMKKIMAHMPAQKITASTEDDAEAQMKQAELSLEMGVTFDMKIERVIQCAHDLHGQRLFKDEDRAQLLELPADDELLEVVNAAVERLTKKANAAGKASGGTVPA